MSITITYFVHGTTTDNEAGLATGWLPGELSAVGKEQAKKLPEQIGYQKFEVMFCSDLKRAVDSAELGFSDLTIIQDARLRECNYGDHNGSDEQFVKAAMTQRITEPFPNGESYKDVETRMIDFIHFLDEKYNGKHVAIMAHQAPQLALEVIANGKTWEQAIREDWRKTKAWQPGWDYVIEI